MTTSENIHIVPAEKEDAGEILDLQKRAFVTEAEAHGNYDIEPLRQSYGSILSDFESHKFLKAVSDGKIVGSVKYRASCDRVWVGKLIVDTACRGRGLGRRLLARVEELNPAAGRFQLFTAASSTHNIRLYESVGYRLVREFNDEAQEGFPMVEMIKTTDREVTMDGNEKVCRMTFASVYPYYVAKAERKGRTRDEVDEIIRWLTGYSDAELEKFLIDGSDIETFFARARFNPAASKITGVICGYRIEEIEGLLMRRVRCLDKLIDELARGRSMDKILRK